MLAQEAAVVADEQHAAVEGAALPLDDADGQHHVRGLRQLAQHLGLGAGDRDRGLEIAPEPVPAFRGAGSDPDAEIDALGVAAQEGLREQGEPGALPGRLGHALPELVHGARRIEQDRACLDHRHAGAVRCHFEPPGIGARRRHRVRSTPASQSMPRETGTGAAGKQSDQASGLLSVRVESTLEQIEANDFSGNGRH